MLAMQPRNSSASWGEAANEAAMFLATILPSKSSTLLALMHGCPSVPTDRAQAISWLKQSGRFGFHEQFGSGQVVHLLSAEQPLPLPPALEESHRRNWGPAESS